MKFREMAGLAALGALCGWYLNRIDRTQPPVRRVPRPVRTLPAPTSDPRCAVFAESALARAIFLDQVRLYRLGELAEEATGRMTPASQTALRSVQSRAWLPPTGVYDAQTHAAIDQEFRARQAPGSGLPPLRVYPFSVPSCTPALE